MCPGSPGPSHGRPAVSAQPRARVVPPHCLLPSDEAQRQDITCCTHHRGPSGRDTAGYRSPQLQGPKERQTTRLSLFSYQQFISLAPPPPTPPPPSFRPPHTSSLSVCLSVCLSVSLSLSLSLSLSIYLSLSFLSFFYFYRLPVYQQFIFPPPPPPNPSPRPSPSPFPSPHPFLSTAGDVSDEAKHV